MDKNLQSWIQGALLGERSRGFPESAVISIVAHICSTEWGVPPEKAKQMVEEQARLDHIEARTDDSASRL